MGVGGGGGIIIVKLFCRKILQKVIGSWILLIEAVRSWWSCIYQEFKAIFEENKQGIKGKSRTSIQFITFKEYTGIADKADKCLDARPSRSLFTALYIICMTRIGRDSLTVNIFQKGWTNILIFVASGSYVA